MLASPQSPQKGVVFHFKIRWATMANLSDGGGGGKGRGEELQRTVGANARRERMRV
jgi:hypothetical protein